jgi:hypothetical protein
MCDASILNALLEQARSAPEVTVKSEILLQLLDPVMIVTLNAPKRRAKREKAPVDPNDEKCARWLFKVLQMTAPKAKEPNFTTWTNEVRLMRERDDRTHKEICELFLWAHKSDFWRGNILSPKNLREHWDRLTIQKDTAEDPRKANAAWWLSDEAKLAKAMEVGVGPAHSGESSANWEARIRAAIDNGGKPPAPISMIRPQAGPTSLADLAQAVEPVRRAGKPEGLVQMMKEIGPIAPRGRAA